MKRYGILLMCIAVVIELVGIFIDTTSLVVVGLAVMVIGLFMVMGMGRSDENTPTEKD